MYTFPVEKKLPRSIAPRPGLHPERRITFHDEALPHEAEAGGRSGVTAIVTGLLFIVALFVAPLVGAIPAAATAPALILVGSLMMSHIAEIDWSDTKSAVPAFLTITMIPLSFSIANGLAFGFTAWTLMHLFRGEWRRINWFVYVLTALFLVRFWYLGAH